MITIIQFSLSMSCQYFYHRQYLLSVSCIISSINIYYGSLTLFNGESDPSVMQLR